MPKYTGLSPEAEAQEEADVQAGRELKRPDSAPKPPAPKPKSPDRPYKKVSPDRPYKKMASGGSVRGRGCETKGFGKGTMR